MDPSSLGRSFPLPHALMPDLWWQGVIFGVTATAGFVLVIDNLVIPWIARTRIVRLLDRRAARARRSNGSG